MKAFRAVLFLVGLVTVVAAVSQGRYGLASLLAILSLFVLMARTPEERTR